MNRMLILVVFTLIVGCGSEDDNYQSYDVKLIFDESRNQRISDLSSLKTYVEFKLNSDDGVGGIQVFSASKNDDVKIFNAYYKINEVYIDEKGTISCFGYPIVIVIYPKQKFMNIAYSKNFPYDAKSYYSYEFFEELNVEVHPNFIAKEIKNNISLSEADNNLEFNDEVRKLAFIAGRDKIQKSLIKDGSTNIKFYPYNSNKVRYLGKNSFLVNIYCTYNFDGFKRKKGFQLEMFYYGNNTWKTELLKQMDID